jgi:hypothetical protein
MRLEADQTSVTNRVAVSRRTSVGSAAATASGVGHPSRRSAQAEPEATWRCCRDVTEPGSGTPLLTPPTWHVTRAPGVPVAIVAGLAADVSVRSP